MTHEARMGSNRAHAGWRLVATLIAVVVLLPPLLAFAAAPFLLLLFPVAWLAIPFLITTLLCNALAAHRAKGRPVARWSVGVRALQPVW